VPQKKLLEDVGGRASRLLGITCADHQGVGVKSGKERSLCWCPEALAFINNS
jgi:hypothetical protein